MKKIIILVAIFLLCGCSSNYELEIKNNSFKEKINVVVEKNKIIAQANEYGEVDDQVTPFLNNKTYAIYNSDKEVYKKKVKNYDDYTTVDMSYKYDAAQFRESSSINLCFEKHELNFEDSYYIHLYGTFYCLYTENIDINIKTNNKVISNNADEVNGSVYTWHIDSSNMIDSNIEFNVEKGFYIDYVLIITIMVVIIGLGIAVKYVITKQKSNNEV